MLTTKLQDLLGIVHPVVLGGMGLGTNPKLVAAVSNAGGLGIQGGCAGLPPADILRLGGEIRELTERPFGLNLLLFLAKEEEIAAVLEAAPPVFSTAWAAADQDLKTLFARAHGAGARVVHMVSSVPEASRAVEAGADSIFAQGSEGGGHVGLMGTMALVPLVVREVSPVPVIAAGGLADGAGLVAALMLGAEGALYGTRFLATREASIPVGHKQAIVADDGHDTILTEIPDVARATVWPGAYARVKRNLFVENWLGREGELRYAQPQVASEMRQAYEEEDLERTPLYMGQSAGAVHEVVPGGALVERIVAEATELLRKRAPSLVAGD